MNHNQLTAQLAALFLIVPALLAILASAIASALALPCRKLARASEQAEWEGMISDELALAAWGDGMQALAGVDAMRAREASERARQLAAWGTGMALLASVDADRELEAVFTASLKALAKSSARIDADRELARFALAARASLGFGTAWRDAA